MDSQTAIPQAPQDQQVDPSFALRQQIVDTIRGGKNILVTVGTKPTVDELSSAVGLTFLLGKLDKHVTTVFSGEIPAAMEFLDPDAVFENTVDSLRDFIIALDKEKADKLRYKVEDDVVKVFITPYKTVISEKDLQFSQGDFNVDVVVALGVENREDLDSAITKHGRILHDASVVVINSGSKKSNLGAIDWNDSNVSSVAEMLVGLIDSFGSELLDTQISTAFLTGIVAETNRFSNEKTSPRVMALSAQLMAAGANQQLIASNLRHEGMISEPVRAKQQQSEDKDDSGEMVLDHQLSKDESTTDERRDQSASSVNIQKNNHKKKGVSKKPSQKNTDTQNKPIATEESPAASLQAAVDQSIERDVPLDVSEKPDTGLEVSHQGQQSLPSDINDQSSLVHERIVQPLTAAPAAEQPADEFKASVQSQAEELPKITPLTKPEQSMAAPSFGGTLSATTAAAEDAAAEEKKREAAVNNIALSHDNHRDDDIEAARKAVESASSAQPFNPANQPIESLNAAPLTEAVAATQQPDPAVSEIQSARMPSQGAPEPSPVDAFMRPQAAPNALNDGFTVNEQPYQPQSTSPMPSGNMMPPLPPMPSSPDGALPPLPPMPGQSDPATGFQPQINPGFMQDMPQSQNSWTQAGDELAAKQAEKAAARQEKMDQMSQQYDQAVDRNRELQGLPPVNNPTGHGMPPLPPTSV